MRLTLLGNVDDPVNTRRDRPARLPAALSRRVAPVRQVAVVALVAVAALFALPPQAQAQTLTTLVSNTGETLDSGSTGSIVAQNFRTGANADGYTISEVDIRLHAGSGSTSTSVSIRKNTSGEPGDLVAALTNPSPLSRNSLNTFTAPVGTRLDASTTYWITVSEGISNRAPLSLTFSNAQTGEQGWRIGNDRLYRSSDSDDWTTSESALVIAIKGIAGITASTDATLSDLTLTDDDGNAISLTPTFVSVTTSYMASVANRIDAVTLTAATQNDSNAMVAITSDDDTTSPGEAVLPLTVGSNTLTVTVTAEDGSTMETYTVAVTRGVPVPVDIEPNYDTIGAGLEDLVFTLTREGAATDELEAMVTIVQEQTWLGNSDLSKTVTFVAGSATATLTLGASRFSFDPDTSGDLTATVSGTGIAGGEATVQMVSTADAPITVSYDKSSYTFAEDATDVEIYVLVALDPAYPRAPSRSFYLSFTSASDTAISPGDYGIISWQPQFVQGDFALDVSKFVARKRLRDTGGAYFGVEDDDVYEGSERLVVILERSPNLPSGLVQFVRPNGDICEALSCSPRVEYPVTITDEEDRPVLSLSAEPASLAEEDDDTTTNVTENVSVLTVAAASPKTFATDQAITLTFAGIAVYGTHYSVNPADTDANATGHQVLLPAETASVEVTVTAVGNASVDGGRTIEVAGLLDGTAFGTATTITLLDDDTAPTDCEIGAFWCTTLTVGEHPTNSPEGYCGPGAGTEHCDYGGLGDDDFTLDGTGYTVESLRWGGNPGKLHLTLDKDFPDTSLGNLTLRIGEHSFALVDAGRGNQANDIDNNYKWSLPAIIDLRDLVEDDTITAQLLGATTNTAATGTPSISGTAQVGQTLTAGIGDIADAEDLPSTVFPAGYSFQWVRVDSSNNETDVGTVSSTYSPASSDVGSTIKVEVSFTDGAGNAETVPSAPTAAVLLAAGPCPAGSDWCTTMTVASAINPSGTETGYAQNGLGALDDTTIEYGSKSYSVYRLNTRIGSGEDYVEIGFDNAVEFLPLGSVFNFGGTEFTADATSEQTVLGQYRWDSPSGLAWIDGQKVTVSANLAPAPESATVDGTSLVLTHAEDLDTASTPAASAYVVKVNGGTGASPSSVSVSTRTVTLTLADAVTAADTMTVDYDAPASSPLQDVSGLDAPDFTNFPVTNNTVATNTAATGQPGISGTAAVGQMLTATTSGITDTDGKTKAEDGDTGYAYTYQWILVDGNTETDISGETSSTYTPSSSDVGKTIRVRVSFTDDLDNAEGPFTSEQTAAVTEVIAPGVTVSKRALTVTEEDTTGGSYTVVLDTQPTATVTVTVAGHAGTDVTRTPGTLTFTTSNWATVQTVTVTAGDDADTTDDSVALTHSAASADSGYSGIAIPSVAVTVSDNDTARVTGLTVTPGNAQLAVNWTAVDNATGYKVQWKSGSQGYNTGNRQSTVTSGSTTSHTITGLANGTEYTVQVSATRTGANDGPASAEKTGTPAVPTAPGVTVSKTALTVTEQDTTGGSYTVVLDSEPTATVTVTVAGHAGTDVTPNPTTLTFTASNWDTVKTVTVTAGDDADTTDDSVTLTHSAASADSGYSGITIAGVAVTVSDNDTTTTNTAATGMPTISGTAQVGEILMALTSGISDADGLPASFTYRWVRVDSDGTSTETGVGSNSNRYSPTAADVGKKIRVKVSFTDNAGNSEGPLTSDAYPASGTIAPASTTPPPDTDLLVSNTGEALANGVTSSINAQSFVTGFNAGGYTISAVQIRLKSVSGKTTVVRIREDDNGNPGDLVATLTNPASLSSYDINMFTAPPGTTLAASTTYWITTGEGIFILSRLTSALTGATAEIGEPGWSIGDGRLYRSRDREPWYTSTQSSLMIAIKGTAIGAASDDATLGALTVNDGTSDLTLAPAFATGTFAYAAEVGNAVTTVTLTAMTTDDGASVSGVTLDGTAIADRDFTNGITVSSLHAGDNEIVVTVTAENGDTRTYTVTVTVSDNDTAQVTGVSVTSGNARLAVNWTAVDNATGYKVQWKSGGQGYNTGSRQFTVTSGSTTSHTITGLANGTEYTVQVSATRTGANDGPPSAEETGTPAVPTVAGVTVSPTTLTVTEQDTTGDGYTVALDTEPTANVTVTVAGHSGTDVTPDPTTLTFTASNWDAAQTVTVTAGDDADTTDDSVTLTHSAASTDSDYSGITIAEVAVTVSDNDTAVAAGICERTKKVRDELLRLIGNNEGAAVACADVTTTHLTGVTGAIDLSFGRKIAALKAGDFAGLTSLTDLYLFNNALTTLPDDVFDDLTALEILTLGRNNLPTLPAGVFDRLIALTELGLDNNALSSLPGGVFDELGALDILVLAHNGLTTLPGDVFDALGALTELNLQDNALTGLTAGVFDRLEALEVLTLDENGLTTLPDGVFDRLGALEVLTLDGNGLTGLPDGVFDRLGALEVLTLRRNGLAKLPGRVFEPLTALKDLRLQGNPGVPFAPEAVALPDDGTVPVAGGAVTLDGSDGGAWGTNVTYSWALTTPVSGVTVTFDDDTSAMPVVTIPALPADTELIFTLTVSGVGGTDGIDPATDTARVTVTRAASAGVSVSPTALTVTEEDLAGAGYTVVLDTLPMADVTVTVAGHARTDLTVTPDPATLTFTSTNWSTAQTVTVAAGDDEDTTDDTVTLTHSAESTDGNYNDVEIADVAVTVTDNDLVQVTGVEVEPGNARLAVSWTAVGNATGYKVQWKSGSENYDTTDRQATIASGSTTSHTITGLANATWYTVRVSATRTGASEGPPSAEAMGRPRGESGGICGRTPAVRDALLDLIEENDGRIDCANVSAADLAAITGRLDLSGQGIAALKAGDFAGLTGLTQLYLYGNALSSLPGGVFADLSVLDNLDLNNNDLPSLPGGVFAGLTELTNLALFNNELTTLPAGVFAGLSSLRALSLDGNGLTALPGGVFAGLTELGYLNLDHNNLTRLPGGVFEPLTALTDLQLVANDGAPFSPAAVALPDGGTVPAGGMVTLDGSGSGGAWGANVTYDWALTTPVSGVTFDENTSATPVVTIPVLAADVELTFTLTVTGGGGAKKKGVVTGADTATVTVTPAARSARAAAIPEHDEAESPPLVSVADVKVREGPGAVLAFNVMLDPAPVETATVDWETLDGSAKAGEDYVAASGTLVFAPGETVKTVNVAVLDDAHDERQEVMLLVLSNAQGAVIGDAVAKGTIKNSDAMPAAWLTRFGRAASDHVVEAVSSRWQGGPQVPHLTLGGRQAGQLFGWSGLGGQAERDTADERDEPVRTDPSSIGLFAPSGGAGAELGATAPGMGVSGMNAMPGGPGGVDREAGRTLSGRAAQGALLRALGLPDPRAVPDLRTLLMSSSFFYSAALDDDGRVRSPGRTRSPGWLGEWSAWGRTAATRFQGNDEGMALDGEVATAMLGFDSRWDRWLAGLVVSYSEGQGTYTHPTASGGAVTSTMAGLHPYARFELNERTSFWGVLGYGAGELSLTPERSATALGTDLTNAMAAFGGRTALSVRTGQAGRFELAVRSDARLTSTASDAIEGLAGAAGQTGRVRLMLEGSGSMPLATGGVLKPTLEAGLRYDAGDAETGAGLEVGGGLGYAAGRLSVEINARGLLAHEDTGYEEWGFGGSIAYTPSEDGRGLSMRLGSAWGATQSGVQSLWSRQDASGLVRNAAFDAAQRYQVELRYGFDGRKGHARWEPYVGVESGDGSSRALRLGVTLTSGRGLDAGLELGRRQGLPGADPEHAVQLRGELRW